MINSTQGLILKQIKHNDKSNIVTIFTRQFGKRSFIVYGINSRTKGKTLRNILQPLYLVSLQFYHKETQTLGKIKEISLAYPYSTIVKDFNKKAVMIFLSEVLYKTLLEHLTDTLLFDFIANSLKLYDLQEQNYVNFHVLFLTKLTKYLGIEPVNNFSSQARFFSISEARFTGNYDATLSFDNQTSEAFSTLLDTDITDFDKLRLSRQLRNNLLKGLLNYYAYHIENFGKINSLEILNEIFDA